MPLEHIREVATLKRDKGTRERTVIRRSWYQRVRYGGKSRYIKVDELNCCKILRMFGHLLYHISKHDPTMFQEVALKCYLRLARP